MNIQIRVVGKETSHSGSFMPGSIVGPKVDGQAFETRYDFGEHFEKPVRVSSHPFHNSMKPVKRIDPAKKIETFMMLAFCVHVRLRASLSPETRELRVKREPRLFNDNYFFRVTTIKIPGQRQLFFP
ncbi:MAG TPA: hypothetical protein VEF34_13200, partial [Syntrophobacteraceae bacterium]|nr:hypothetical protein [Syntrophobacteraceae bacterium]